MKYLVVLAICATVGCGACAGPMAYDVPKMRDSFELIKCDAIVRQDGKEGLVCFYLDPKTSCARIMMQYDGEEPKKRAELCKDQASDYLPGGPKFNPAEWASL